SMMFLAGFALSVARAGGTETFQYRGFAAVKASAAENPEAFPVKGSEIRVETPIPQLAQGLIREFPGPSFSDEKRL
ncbi:MAG: hypothetical protein AAB339_04385, partial [Elusimicrobiota bacterium]